MIQVRLQIKPATSLANESAFKWTPTHRDAVVKCIVH